MRCGSFVLSFSRNPSARWSVSGCYRVLLMLARGVCRPTKVQNMPSSDIIASVQKMCTALPEGTQSAFYTDSEQAQRYYADFVEFVARTVPTRRQKTAVLLDVSCGWFSFAFASNHSRVPGVAP